MEDEMEPTEIEYKLTCPEDGQQVTVRIDCCEDGYCSVSKCTHFQDKEVTCGQQCLESVTHGTHWDASCSGCAGRRE
jgi:hypothetical protein